MDIIQLSAGSAAEPAAATPPSNSFALRLAGRFDAHETDAFRAILAQILETPADGDVHVAVSLAEVEFIDSTALAELVRGMKNCRERGGDLVLVSPSDPVRVILELTKLDLAFTIE